MKKLLNVSLTFFVFGQILFAQGISYNQEFQINTYTSGHQDWPDICTFNDSGFIACWTSSQDGNGDGIYGQIFNNKGIKTDKEFQINSYTMGNQHEPNAGNLIDGGFVVSWSSFAQDGDGYGIFAQIFNADGTYRGDEFQVNTYTSSNQKYPCLSGLSDGKFVICWVSSEQDGSGDGVYCQIFNSDGSDYGIEFQVDTNYEYGQTSPSVSKISDDRFIIVWASYFPDEKQYEIFGQIFNNNGDKNGDKFTINSYTDNFQINPDVAYLSNGNFVVCWQSDTQDGSSNGIYAQMFNGNGDMLGSEISVNTYTILSQENPSVEMLNEGKFIICWMSKDQDGDEYGIYGQLFNSAGLKMGKEFQINSFTKSYQSKPKVSSLLDNGLIVCWVSYNQDGSYGGIFGKYYLNEPIIHKLQSFSVLKPIYNTDNKTTSFIWHESNLLPVNFPWELNYKIYLDKSDDFLSPQIISTNYDTTYTLHNLEPGQYYWKVLAKNFSGDSLWSREIAVFPESINLNSFSLLEPNDDKTLNITKTLFKWINSNSAKTNFPWELEYSLYLDENNNFSSPTVIRSIYDTTCTIQDLVPGTTYFWKVLAKNIAGDSLWSSDTFGFFVDWDATTSLEEKSVNKCQDYKLQQNYPNPFNPNTTIKFELAHSSYVLLKIFDIQGREVAVLMDDIMHAGQHQVSFNAEKLASGVYFYHIIIGNYSETRKMLLMR